ncbi:MAG: glutathione S-transferase C-terminal domain-containing protein [Steroidobacteraceae bacterium]
MTISTTAHLAWERHCGPWRMPDWSGAREWGERRGALALQGLPYFNDLLSRQAFVAGDAFSMADITLFASLAFAEGIGLPIAGDLTSMAAWRQTVSELPAVRDRSGQHLRPEDIARRGA